MSRTWLADLKLEQLHRLAVLVGSPCSGNKATRIQKINQAVDNATTLFRSNQSKNPSLSIVSIDMGIRNLAYCNLKTPWPGYGPSGLDSVLLEKWQRVEVVEGVFSATSNTTGDAVNSTDAELHGPGLETKESFEPQIYAKHAYGFIKTIIDEHKPSHVLIERQRFRSGGGSAVQEWSIRVGVFEAMLYATLRTLMEQEYWKGTVVPMPPTMINRFWVNASTDELLGPGLNMKPTKARQKQSDHVKRRKIQVAGGLLVSESMDDVRILLSSTASKVREDFLAKLNKERKPQSSSIPKLDDLADSLLQGLAWICWQRNRLRLEAMGEKAFDV